MLKRLQDLMSMLLAKLGRIPVFAWAMISAVVANGIALIFLPITTYYDWDYFNGLSLVSKSIPLVFRSFSFFDAWKCGGLDILANPQSRIASPIFLLDLLLPPHVANLSSIIVYGCFGFYGMYVLARHLAVAHIPALLCAFLFINSSWFGLHFSEGHIPFAQFQLLPWIIWIFLDFANPKRLAVFFALMALFLIDGAFYPFIFAIHIFMAMVLVGLIPLRTLAIVCFDRTYLVFGLIAAWGLVSSFKLVPLLSMHAERIPQLGSVDITEYIFTVFFRPFTSQTHNLGDLLYRYHEYGCYIGVPIVLILAYVFLTRRGWLQQQLQWLLFGLIFLWIGLGFGGVFNPWTLLSSIPLLNNAHVQSRQLLMFFLVVIILLGRALSTIDHKVMLRVLIGILAIEGIVVRNYPIWHVYDIYPKTPVGFMMPFKSIESTSDEDAPALYMRGTVASKSCYEPAFTATDVQSVKSSLNYQGEVYTKQGSANIELKRRYGGLVSLSFKDATPGTYIVVNTNKQLGWRLANDDARVVNIVGSELLTFKVNVKDGTIDAVYSPFYIPWIYFSYLAGLCLFGGIFWFLFRARRNAYGT